MKVGQDIDVDFEGGIIIIGIEGQLASHEYDVDELDQVGRGGSFPFCAVLEKDPGRYFFGTRVVSLEGKSVFSQILDTL